LTRQTDIPEHELLKKLSLGDKGAFNQLIESYYTSLCRSALKYIRSKEQAEEIVQDVFVSLWERRETIVVTTSLAAYLHTSVKYQSINALKKKLARPDTEAGFPEHFHPTTNEVDELFAGKELEELVQDAITALPARCRIVFDLSRNAGLTYNEIATQLDISPKTVETQISIALARIKAHLGKYWEVFIPVFILATAS
jgi:RNA polymerase sigma-70 factor, ECF subfamily